MPGEAEIVDTFLKLVNAVAMLSFNLQLVAEDGKSTMCLQPQLDEGTPHPTKDTARYKVYAHNLLCKALGSLEPRGSQEDIFINEQNHTLVFLTCQLPPFSIVQDEQATYSFLKNLKSGGSLTIASPYFNLTSKHINVRCMQLSK
jgi:hypothetical protein